jgi:hypothetical protein
MGLPDDADRVATFDHRRHLLPVHPPEGHDADVGFADVLDGAVGPRRVPSRAGRRHRAEIDQLGPVTLRIA